MHIRKRKTRYMERIVAAIAVVIFFYCSSILANATEEDEKERHFVIMYDVSKSMNGIDGKKQALDMIVTFINRIPTAQFRNVKIAVIKFSDKPENLLSKESINWWYLEDTNEADQKKCIREAIYQSEYDGDYTDIGAAMQCCENTLKAMREGVDNYQQTVLFVTDGFIDLAGDGDKGKDAIAAIYDSYTNLINVSNNLPVECCFLGIAPKEDYRPKEIEVNAQTQEIASYYGKVISDEERPRIKEVIRAMDTFKKNLQKRQGEGWKYRSDIIEVDWGEDNILEMVGENYDKFYDKIFDGKTQKKENIDLSEGYDFYIPESVEEVSISIIPKKNQIEEKRDAVSEIMEKGNLQILYGDDQEVCTYDLYDSHSAVTAQISKPKAGNYQIKCTTEMKIKVDLKFSAYGDLSIQLVKGVWNGVLGETLYFSGKILDGDNKDISDELMKYLTMYIRDNDTNEMTYITDLEGNSFAYNYVLASEGEHHLSFGLIYNDSEREETGGISVFSNETDVITVYVPEVQFELGKLDAKYLTNEEVMMEITAFSILEKEEIQIKEDVCRKFLDTRWLLWIDGNLEEEMETNSEKNCFEVGTTFSQKGNYQIEFRNAANSEVLSAEITVVDPVLEWSEYVPDEIKMSCNFLACSTELQIKDWVSVPENNLYKLYAQENEDFKIEPSVVQLGKENNIIITRKGVKKFHWPKESKILFVVVNPNGEKCLNGEIIIKEKIAVWLLAALAIAGIIVLFLFVSLFRRQKNMVKLIVYLNGIQVKKGKIKKKEGARTLISLKANGTVEVQYKNGEIKYRYKGTTGSVNETGIINI